MYSFATLDGHTVTYFEPPHWDEAIWLCGTLPSLAICAAILVLSARGLRRPRTAAERWMTVIAVLLCFSPLVLHLVLTEERRIPWTARRGADVFAWMVVLALISAAFQTWNWFNGRQPAWFVAWAILGFYDRVLHRLGARRYRRPGRP
jgi:hypothetical protein